MRVVLGLGNPGRTYESHRHNVGATVVEELAGQWGWRMARRSRLYDRAEGVHEGCEVMLARPRTFMNESGRAATAILSRTGSDGSDRLLVVLDDWNLPVGRIRFRVRGSAGGHRGLDSIIRALGTEEIDRCRIGIGELVGEATEFVLSDFTGEERARLAAVRGTIREGIICWIREGIEAAMNKYNN